MQPAYLLGLALVVVPLDVAAQSSASGTQFHVQSPNSYGVAQMEPIGPDGKAKTVNATPPNPCPVSLEARHVADGEMVKAGAAHAKGRGQALHLTLTSPDSRTIASATVKLNGWIDRSRMQPASQDAAQAFRILQAPFTAGANRSASADVWAPGLTAVDSIELLAVTYADGSAWSPAAGKTCRITPDLLMRVGR